MGFFSFFNFGKDKRQEQRINLIPLHNITVKVTEPELTQVSLVNLSLKGLGIVKHHFTRAPKKNEALNGVINFEGQTFMFQSRVAHVSNYTVGCEITSIDASYARCWEKYFTREIEAIKMNEVNSSSLKNPNEGEARWFQGGDHCSLYFVKHQDIIKHFEIVFFGNIIHGGEGRKTLMGEIQADEQGHFKQFQGSAILEDPVEIDSPMRECLLKFIANIHQLDSAAKERLSFYMSYPGKRA